jgi:nicotinate phosphoribosyltransferase
MNQPSDALLTDLYQLNMIQAYLDYGQRETAVFEFFMRRLPGRRGFLMASGLEQVLQYLETLRFSDAELAWLEKTGRFRKNLLDYLAAFRFTGDVHAMPEGTVYFANEPVIRVTAPLPDGQYVETRLINILHFQSLIATKAARMLQLAPGKLMVDFGLRRAHGAEAGLMAARASYVAGFGGTATVLAGEMFNIPLYGTMAHSFIQSFDDEEAAFESFARARPNNLVLLIDTYDTVAAARKVVRLAPKLKDMGIKVYGVRIDSGDLVALSKSVRAILDDGGLRDTIIFASGGLEDEALAKFSAEAAPIDGYGIGTSMTTSSDAPTLDCAYKLEEYAGLPRRKYSPGKQTWPGRKQVWRRYGADGRMVEDVLSTEDDTQEGTPLIKPVMIGGKRVGAAPTFDDIRAHARRELATLPERLTRLVPGEPYPVRIGERIEQLAREVDRRMAIPAS